MDAKTKLPKTFLSVEQQQVLQKVLADGENIFFTGSAGKLFVLFTRFTS
jgi:hypothetical protein